MLSLLTLFGLLGQGLFMMRFVAQWLFSEKAKRSVIPEIFWYFSLGGGVILFIYALLKNDIVFILGQGLGLVIYIRNIFFIWRDKAKRKNIPHDVMLDDLEQAVADLQAREQKGEELSPHTRRAIADALQILKK